ncbi:MAG: nucleotidyltransferase domain-containing protein [Candidatus Nanoarchaeia archaeon]|nr:nucleotidyltransferase domain-containing protein [Candidatus Nanoarchaeia archaeon]
MSIKLKNVKTEYNEAYQKALHWFFAFPDSEMNLSSLSNKLKISKTTAGRVIKKLVNEKFLKVNQIGRTLRITCNKNHIYNYSKKVSYNLMVIYESGIIEKIHELIKNPRAIILFGSYRKGDDIETSDIDIAVEIIDNEGLRITEIGIIPQLGHRENVKVNLHTFSRNKVDINLFSNIANGIILEGFLEVKI